MKCPILFSGKNIKKLLSVCHLLTLSVVHEMISVNNAPLEKYLHEICQALFSRKIT